LSDYGTGKRYEIENNDTVSLDSAFFIYRGHIYPQGKLLPGEKTSRIFYGTDSPDSTHPADGWKNSFSDDPDKFEKIRILEAMFEYNRFDYLLNSDTITFAGWLPVNRPEILSSIPFGRGKDFSLLLVPLETGGTY
ncbi:MAG: hypothetical protein JW874_14795, partial [Spirochaetales bacterium]|nr:hypothetical protein [Spirochaetales bacterium]